MWCFYFGNFSFGDSSGSGGILGDILVRVEFLEVRVVW